MRLDTNLEAAEPFLMKPTADGHGLKRLPSNIGNDDIYFYQATSYKNLASIKTSGLDPNYGGKGGSGAVVGGNDGNAFNVGSSGKVHGTSSSATVSFYALMKDSPATYIKAFGNIGDLENKPEPTKLADFAIILRFSRKICNWIRDPDDPRNAFCTKDMIPASRIEGLTTEGWVKILDLTELDKALTDPAQSNESPSSFASPSTMRSFKGSPSFQ